MSSIIFYDLLQRLFPYPKDEEPKISRMLVIICYYMFLRRPPENEEVIRHHMNMESLEKLYFTFIDSDECKNLLKNKSIEYSTLSKNSLVGAPKQTIETDTDEETMKQIIEHTKNVWTKFGDTEPHWSVVTQDDYLQSNLEENLEKFYDHGSKELRELIAILERNDVDVSKLETCLEFGCGVGRFTRWLADGFPHVVGVDISKPHLDHTRSQLSKVGVDNVELAHLQSLEGLDDLPRFDLLYSKIVFQHNPPPVIAYTLKKLFAKLNKNGIAFFQLPTYTENYTFKLDEYLNAIEKAQGMEMHAFPQKRVYEIANEAGLAPLEIMMDGSVGGIENISTVFVLKKL